MRKNYTLGGLLLGAFGLLLLIAGCGGTAAGVDAASGPTIEQTAPAAAQTGGVADPVRVRIPSIGVDAAIEPLLVDETGTLPPPSGHDITGWWSQGPEPGEPGPAVITGHVNSAESGPSVFARLTELQRGDQIIVERADGTSVTFVAQHSETHSKEPGEFPTEAVYGDTPGPELRLITCGGGFDPAAGRYLDNVIVWAMPA